MVHGVYMIRRVRREHLNLYKALREIHDLNLGDLGTPQSQRSAGMI